MSEDLDNGAGADGTGRRTGAPGRHHQAKRGTARRVARWFVVPTLVAAIVGTTYGLDRALSHDDTPVHAGTVLGWRFSGDYPHRCRLWVRPDGAPYSDRPVLVEPNDSSECLSLRTFDRWKRRP